MTSSSQILQQPELSQEVLPDLVSEKLPQIVTATAANANTSSIIKARSPIKNRLKELTS